MATCPTAPRVAIVGAGVIGLSVGLCLLEQYSKEVDVTIMADKFSPETTSDSAGGIITWQFARHLTDPSSDLNARRARGTFYRLKELYESPKIAAQTGISLFPGYVGCSEKCSLVDGPLMNAKELTKDEAAALGPEFARCESVFSGSTFFVNGTTYLPWLMEEIRSHGGLIVRRRIQSLSELSGYDVIINCTGLRARELVGDMTVFPTRGQTVLVKAPKLGKFFCIFEERGSTKRLTYALRHREYVVLGGTAEPDNWSTIPDPNTTKDILERCCQVDPCLREAEVLGSVACLRPSRESGVRLEVEDTPTGPVVIHNYGHGSQGIIWSWGCAMEAVQLVEQCLRERDVILTKTRAKL